MRTQILLIFLAVATSFVALAIPLIQRRVLRNWVYGLRTRATMADEHVWMEANALTGRDLAAVAALVAAAGVVLYFVRGLPDLTYSLVMALMLLAGVLATAVRGWWFARRLWHEREMERP